jgi:hypothetical protein
VVGGRSAFTVELLPREEKNSERKKYWNLSSGFSATLHVSDCGRILRLVILLHLLL